MDIVSGAGDLIEIIWKYAVPFVLILSVLVFVHEYGHYWVAKKCGVRIDAFSIGFGKELVGWNDKHGTRWQISAIPLGGYVKMFGDADPTSAVPDAAHRREEEQSEAKDDSALQHFAEVSEADHPLSDEEKAVSFHYKSLPQRAAVVAAGPATNFIFAILALTVLFSLVGQPYTPSTIGFVDEGSVAEQAGLEVGDVITAIDGRKVERFEQVDQNIRLNQGSAVSLTILRDGEQITVSMVPEVLEVTNKFGDHDIGDVGIWPIDTPVVGSIRSGSPAEQAGFALKDLVVAVNGAPISRFIELQDLVAASPEQEMVITVKRDDTLIELFVTPMAITVEGENGEEQIGQIGVTRDILSLKRYNPVVALGRAAGETWDMVTATLRTISQIVVGARDANQIGGPLRIAQLSGETAQSSVAAVISFMALLSVNLGLINLFPIPMLDGGHLLFYAIEAVRGKPLGATAQEYGFRFGMALVVTLAVFALWNDLVQLKIISAVTDMIS